MNWLEQALDACVLSEDTEQYLLGRGAREEAIEDMGFLTWSDPGFDIEDEVFCKRYGPRGEAIQGHLVTPLYAPKGTLLGAQFRNMHTKWISRYVGDPARWNPLWIGSRRATQKLWDGSGVWIVEGLFDLLPLEWVVPSQDAVLAASTARLSIKHVNYLKRFNPPFINLVFDKDEAGRNGIEGYIDKDGKEVWGAKKALARAGLPFRAPSYGGRADKDPGDIWDRGGVQALREAFNQTR